MASNPPFLLEDQTDEDFFDKLVDDDDDVDFKVSGGPLHAAKVAPVFIDGNESDEAKAFANLSIAELDTNEETVNDTGIDDSGGEMGLDDNGEVLGVVNREVLRVVNAEVKNAEPVSGDMEETSVSLVAGKMGNDLLVAGDSFGLDPVVESNNGNTSSEASSDCTMISKSSGSGASGIKEVQWSAFHADSAQDDNSGFGSYSDFFSELGENSGDSAGNVGKNLNVESKVVAGNDAHKSSYIGDSENDAQYQEGFGYGAVADQGTVGQDMNSSQYWENVYPGWKFDIATGQWHQVEDYDSSTNVQGNVESNSAVDWSVSDGKSEVSYLQQTAQSVTGTVAESGRTECVTNWDQVSKFSEHTETISKWNQVSQGTENPGNGSDWSQGLQINNGYPSHMVFDPQYPDWYYDTIAQEWRPLGSYTASDQSAVHAQDLLNQNGFASTDTYSHGDNQATYGAYGQVNNYNSSQGFSSQGQDCSWAGSFNGNNQQTTSMQEPVSVAKNEVPMYSLNHQLENHQGQFSSENNHVSQGFSSQGQEYNWTGSNGYNQPASGVQEPAVVAHNESASEYGSNYQLENDQGQFSFGKNHVTQLNTNEYDGVVSDYDKHNHGQNDFTAVTRSQSFVSGGNSSQQFNYPRPDQMEQKHVSNGYYGSHNSASFSQQPFEASQQYSYAPTSGRLSAGRPPHALVTFGFGGKLIVMKNTASDGSLSFGSQTPLGCTVSVLNLSEVVAEKAVTSSHQPGACDYFHALSRQSFPGPLAAGNVGTKELNKWIDERIASSQSPDLDYRKGEVLRLLLSLLRIACQYYGKLRSPFGSDTMLKENDLPESAVAKLFASARSNAAQNGQYGSVAHCLQGLPSEGQMRATAAEVQNLLVSGRKKEALHCAQEGQLWGPALIIAAQLGDQFYVDTVKQMALRQLVAGSPLRTLCLLIAGQPADVFSMDITASGSMPGVLSTARQPDQVGVNVMLDDWEENLAVISANRTKDDELVLIHLGDCLWRERSDIIAAHICYLVAEANFEPYSDSARLCLVGADHLKFPRTYASPDSIQRTEIYEYSKVLGNSQFILLPFQPYKFVYAHMLAEVGRISDALKYCQAVLKSLKIGRSPEVETLRQLVSSLEDRIKTHQQGGFSTNLAPAKLVGKLLNLFDSTAHRVVGGLPPPVPSMPGGSTQGNEHPHQSVGPRVSTSQSTMAMSSLMPSGSMEPISEWATDSRMTMHNRSVSEPDFGRSPRQDQVDPSKDTNSTSGQGKAASRFGRFGFGSQLLQKTVGLVLKPRQDRQAKLGDKNKFYYDEKLKRWVEEGAEPPAEEAALPPPPPTTAFQNGTSDYNLKTALKSEGSISNRSPEYRSPTSIEHSSVMPPLPPTSNQFSARGRMGVRSRYVDTFNQGGGNPTNLFQSPSVPSVKPATGANPKFFVPAPVSSTEQLVGNMPDSSVGSSTTDDNPSITNISDSMPPPASTSSVTMQRFPSMDNISKKGPSVSNSSFAAHSRRTASWSGSFNNSLSPRKSSEAKPLGEVLGMPPPSFMPNDSLTHSSVNGGSYGDELHEVEL